MMQINPRLIERSLLDIENLIVNTDSKEHRIKLKSILDTFRLLHREYERLNNKETLIVERLSEKGLEIEYLEKDIHIYLKDTES